MNNATEQTITHCPLSDTHGIFDGGEPFLIGGGEEGVLLICPLKCFCSANSSTATVTAF